METLRNFDITIDINIINTISGGNQEFEIKFTGKDKEQYKLTFERVWDMRYSIENASIMRFCEFRMHLPEGIVDNSIYVVEDSEYIKYFEYQVAHTRPVDDLIHYNVSDEVDTTLDILAIGKPKLEKINYPLY